MCQQKKAEEATEVAREVYEEMEKQMNMISRNLSLDADGERRNMQGTLQEQIDDEGGEEVFTERRPGDDVRCSTLGKRWKSHRIGNGEKGKAEKRR